MKRNGQITAALLAATLTAVGCSDGNKPQGTTSTTQESAKITPVSLGVDAAPTGTTGVNKPIEPIKPAGPVSYFDGEKAYQAGDYRNATLIFERYTTENPKNAWGHYMLGLSAWKGGEAAKAESAFNEALRLDPKHIKSMVNLSRVLIEEKRFDDAVNQLTRARELDSKYADTHRTLGRAYAGQGKIDEAIGSYRTAITLDDKDAWSMNNLGLIFIEQGRFEEATPVLARAVELRKDVPIFSNNLGMALERTGHYTGAKEAYNGAVNADPGFEKAQKNLTRVENVKPREDKPFDLEATAKRFVEQQQPQTPANETVTGQ
jgi:Flp pilus assembly protein TadD